MYMCVFYIWGIWWFGDFDTFPFPYMSSRFMEANL